jgi:hypothetical protein
MTIQELIKTSTDQISHVFFEHLDKMLAEATHLINNAIKIGSIDDITQRIAEQNKQVPKNLQITPCIKHSRKNNFTRYSTLLFNHDQKISCLLLAHGTQKHAIQPLGLDGANKKFKLGLLIHDIHSTELTAEPKLIEILNKSKNGIRRGLTEKNYVDAIQDNDIVLIRDTQLPAELRDTQESVAAYRIHPIEDLAFDFRLLFSQMVSMDPDNKQVSATEKITWLMHTGLHALQTYYDNQAGSQKRRHGDVKLENILMYIYKNYTIKLTDEASAEANKKTLCCTCHYIAPEKFSNSAEHDKADLFSLAMCIQEILFHFKSTLNIRMLETTCDFNPIQLFPIAKWQHSICKIQENVDATLVQCVQSADINRAYAEEISNHLHNMLDTLKRGDAILTDKRENIIDIAQLLFCLLDTDPNQRLDITIAINVIDSLKEQYFPQLNQNPMETLPPTNKRIERNPIHSPTSTISWHSENSMTAAPSKRNHKINPSLNLSDQPHYLKHTASSKAKQRNKFVVKKNNQFSRINMAYRSCLLNL